MKDTSIVLHNKVYTLLDKSTIRIDIFSYALSSILEDNLAHYLISTTSNMLALHYAIDKDLRNANPNAQQYADICAGRIKSFLKDKVVLDETFSAAMEIFAIALTPNLPVTEDLPGFDKIRDQEKISEVIVSCVLEGELGAEENALFGDVIDIVFGSADAREIIDLIGANPDIVKAILSGKRRKAQELVDELSKAAKNSSKTQSIISDFAQLAGLVACSAMAFMGNIVAVHSFEAIAAAVVIPVSVVTLKYGATFGEKIGARLAEFESDFKVAKSQMENILSNIAPAFESAIDSITHSKSIDIQEVGISTINLKEIKQNLASHIDIASTSEQVEQIQQSLRKIKNNDKNLER